MGAVRMLQEGAHQFDLLDSSAQFEAYRVLILPDAIPVSAELAGKLARFVDRGGALIATHRAGLDAQGAGFALPELGVELEGEAPFSPDFVVPQGELGRGLPQTGQVIYQRGLEVRPAADAEVLAWVEVPYFERHWRHFCSHRHTPSSGQRGYPAAVRRGRCIYFAHPLFSQYAQCAPRWCKQLALNALAMLLPEPLVRVEGPSTLTTALNEQPGEKRWVLHLLHYVPERRGADFDIIEDVIPLFELKASVRVGPVQTVRCVPEGETLPFTCRDGRVEFVLPKLDGHQMIELRRPY